MSNSEHENPNFNRLVVAGFVVALLGIVLLPQNKGVPRCWDGTIPLSERNRQAQELPSALPTSVRLLMPEYKCVKENYGLPEIVSAAVINEESCANPHDLSTANAFGSWQILDQNLIKAGIPQSQWYDFDFGASIGGPMLVDAYKRYGNWYEAALAYNMGDTGYHRALTPDPTTKIRPLDSKYGASVAYAKRIQEVISGKISESTKALYKRWETTRSSCTDAMKYFRSVFPK